MSSQIKSATFLECAANTIKDRHGSYGDAAKSFDRIAWLWSAALGHTITPKDVALCMALLKVSRELSAPNPDNMVDALAYLAFAAELESNK
jgi:Domain of unknown function (DUF6378)